MNAENRTSRGCAGFGSPSPLAVVGSRFDRAADELVPAGVRLAGRVGPPPTWGRLRAALMDPALPLATVDAVWVSLVRWARSGGQDEALMCAGVAHRLLSRIAGEHEVKAGVSRGRRDIEADVLAGFLMALPGVDLDRPYVLVRLRWAAFRDPYAWARHRKMAPVPLEEIGCPTGSVWRVGSPRPPLMHAPGGHPDLVLAEAVAEGVLTAFQASLVAATRLERVTLTAVAARRGVSVQAVHQWRVRAERKLVAWLAQRAIDLKDASSVELQGIQRAALTAQARDRGRGADDRRALKCRPVPGSGGRGCESDAPALPTSLEVNRRCA